MLCAGVRLLPGTRRGIAVRAVRDPRIAQLLDVIVLAEEPDFSRRFPAERYARVKITAIKTWLVQPERGKTCLFLKLSTDGGVHGWGEA